MPHTPAASAIIVKKDSSGEAGPLLQPQVESYLGNLIHNSLLANLKQCCNDVFGGKGKPTGAFRYAGLPVMHASSGNGAKSVTLFYTMMGSAARIFAMGEHEDSKNPKVASYKVTHYGQAGTSFALNSKVSI